MKLYRFAIPVAFLLLLGSLWSPARSNATADVPALAGDALTPPPRSATTAATVAADNLAPSFYQPSAFLAGRVAVQAIFVESNGSQEPSTHDWTEGQMAAVRAQMASALDWWRTHLPNAHLSFDLSSRVATSGYEPIRHTLASEGLWISEALSSMGASGLNYFEQAYTANQNLRQERGADWAATIFIANSKDVPGGSFADGRFAYAYISGPFMVVTSDAGPYGINQMAQVVTHELGHIFGALDQYAAAVTPCTAQSGYLAVPTTNSQFNSCGTQLGSIMLEPLSAYQAGQIDPSALGQLGYRDSDGDGIPDPLDTTPTAQLQIDRPAGGGRPTLAGHVIDQPYLSPFDRPTTINTITRAEYQVDGGEWFVLPPQDGAYDSASEPIAWTLPLYDGRHTIRLRAANSLGARSSVSSATVDVSGVGAAPAYLVGAPEIANTTLISVSLDAPAGSSVQISEDPLFAQASWQPAAASIRWQLHPQDGLHTLYVRLRDPGGLESLPVTRSVTLDRTPPTGLSIRHAQPSPWLEIQAEDAGSRLVAIQVVSGQGSADDWQPYQTALPLAAQAGRITVRVRDEAGNISAPLTVLSDGPRYLPLLIQ
ncbi:MAG: hypothetical protein IPO81_01660 [Kouleothrix sp.]|nr:hypothetical protein [Kouleothrix sp.]